LKKASDAEKVRDRLRACHLYYQAARVYVRLMDRLDREGPLAPVAGKVRASYQEQAELLLLAVAEEMRDWPETERTEFFNTRLVSDSALRPLLQPPNGVLGNLRRAFGVRAE
jgi:hypothetical protein